MCGRYFFEPSAEIMSELQKRYGHRAIQMARGEVSPGQQAVVKANDKKLRPGWFLMKWGFHADRSSRLLINARMETAFEKPAFREGMRYRRCLIPARGYYEWAKEQAGKQKYALEAAMEELTYLAGLYRHEAEGPALVILTRPALPGIGHIHPRMPLILREKDADAWIGAGEISRAWMETAAVKELRYRPVYQ